jgi:hypothetical protein
VFENGSTLKQIAPEGFPGQVWSFSGFLHRLKSWVRKVLLSADCFLCYSWIRFQIVTNWICGIL